jgi:hypothetical protein
MLRILGGGLDISAIGVQRRPLIYLCGSIGGRTLLEAREWRELATKLLAPEFGVISPIRDYTTEQLGTKNDGRVIAPRETSRDFTDAEIVERDLQDIRRSFLVWRHYLGPSEGSPMECAYAKMFGVPVVVSGIADSAAASPWLRFHSVRILHSLEDTADYIKRYWHPGPENPILEDGRVG